MAAPTYIERLKLDGSVTATTNQAFDLGSQAAQLNNIYAKTLSLGGTATSTITVSPNTPSANRTYTLADEGQNGRIVIDGSGGSVTQLTSNNTAVTLNRRGGTIQMVSAIGAAGSANFTLNNNYIQANSIVLVWTTNTFAQTTFTGVSITPSAIGTGVVTFGIANPSANAMSAALIIQFLII